MRDLYNKIKLLGQKYIIPIITQWNKLLGNKKYNLNWQDVKDSRQNQNRQVVARPNSRSNLSWRNPETTLNYQGQKPALNWRDLNSSTLANFSEQNTSENSGQNSNQTPNIPSTNAPPLIWLDQDNIDRRANRVTVPNSRQFFGKNVNLWKQNDSNQCGVCSLLNVFEVCGIQTNLNNIASIRAKVLRNRINQGELKIENGVYYKEVQSSTRENRAAGWERINDNNFAETFWLSTTDVRTILNQTLENNSSFGYTGINANSLDTNESVNIYQSVRESKICIASVNNNHWICCFQYTNSSGQKVLAKIDSLDSNLISNLGQNPDGTSKTPIDIGSRYPNGSLVEIMFVKSKLNWR